LGSGAVTTTSSSSSGAGVDVNRKHNLCVGASFFLDAVCVAKRVDGVVSRPRSRAYRSHHHLGLLGLVVVVVVSQELRIKNDWAAAKQKLRMTEISE
jgi:hypothetical protein